MSFSKEFLEKTIIFWQPYYKDPLSLEDAREICENITGFFNLLHEWDMTDKMMDESRAVPHKGNHK